MIEADKKKLNAGAKKYEEHELEIDIPTPEEKDNYKELARLIRIWKEEAPAPGEDPQKNWEEFQKELKSGIKINSDDES